MRALEASALHRTFVMHALEFEGEQLPSERPTIPVPPPRESGVRLKVSRIAWSFATVDVVVCDLTRDPRSETYLPRPAGPRKSARRASGLFLARCAAHELDQNESPPSTSTVRALK